ncbi:hypothetical protein OCO53_25715 [Peribacillus frigoritolerans]|uniref:hypothetical protein n=1 Tax=Peribacillus frigoritolerans TaxID=450367 RepID=UPI0021D2BE8C|nr:hypothetical protein [Peribacillus frigoritolerans]MCU6603842.1 hypothetical protein [Peribacillus frigoritolerans]
MRTIPIIEAGLSIVSIWWSIFLWVNEDLFNDVPDLFIVFAEFAPEKGWACIFIAAALIKVLGLLYQKLWLRRIGLSMSFFLYGLISAAFILSDEPLSHGTGTHFVLCIFALYAIREVKSHA